MKVQPEKRPKKVYLDPWVVARKMAETLLPEHPQHQKLVMGAVRARSLKTICALGEIQDVEYQRHELEPILALRQIAALFKKNAAFSDDKRCKSKAWSNFLLGERICRITNKRLNYYFANPDRNDPDIRKWMGRMQAAIAELLGDASEARVDICTSIRLTSGATEDRSRKRSYPFLKITGKIRATLAAVPYIGKTLLHYGVDLASCKFERVEWNTIAFVLKNWLTHRTIAKEGTHILPYQLALDQVLKKVLRKWGVNLNSQERNQEYALRGSLDGSIATIDLKMASDTLALEVLAWLLPEDWFALFMAFRSSSYRCEFGSGTYAKFSSMGNGFTFTLETLIFTAACRALGSRDYAVYGDDIAIGSEYAPDLVRLLRFLGFKVNVEKSYMNPASRFRESCGCDYFEGVLVTPFYLRELPSLDDRAGLSHAVNGLVRASWPGPLWTYLREIVRSTKLRLVPLNEDTRSGVHITAHDAWVTERLKMDKRLLIRGKKRVLINPASGETALEPSMVPNPRYGQAVFEGYMPVQVVRKTKGWRSHLLWHVKKSAVVKWGVDVPRAPEGSTAAYLRQLSTEGVSGSLGDLTVEVSRVAVRTTYGHGTRVYVPIHQRTPLMLYAWSEYVIGDQP